MPVHTGKQRHLADESDLQWFAKELNEALIVKVRGVLGGDEGERHHIVESYHAIRHGNARSETCGRHQDAEF